MRPASDPDLLGQLQGSPAALEAFYRGHVDAVSRYAAARCPTPADVAEVVAATFLRVLDSAHQCDETQGSARAWVLGIAALEVAAITRRDARASDPAVGSGRRLRLTDNEVVALERRLDGACVAPAVAAALDTLATPDRELHLLVASDGLTPREAARVLGMRPVEARARLSRARRRLRDVEEARPLSQPAAPLERRA